MSPLDMPLGVVAAVLGIGSLVGFLAFAAVCELAGRWRR